jgi:hypothetical protein
MGLVTMTQVLADMSRQNQTGMFSTLAEFGPTNAKVPIDHSHQSGAMHNDTSNFYNLGDEVT